jgi:hypothetical protein
MPVRRAPNSGNGRDPGVIFVNHHLQPEPVKHRGGKEVIVNFKPWFFLDSPIDTAKVCKEIKTRVRRGLQVRAHSDYLIARHKRSNLAERLRDLRDPIRMLRL